MIKVLQYVVRFFLLLFEVNNWRRIFTGRVKVRIFLSSGEHMDIIVTSWRTDKTNGTIDTWEATGILKSFQVNPESIIAWRVK